jgi:hypothetical protein
MIHFIITIFDWEKKSHSYASLEIGKKLNIRLQKVGTIFIILYVL